MAKTSIEWADHSINPLRARNLQTGKIGHFCVKVSQGCKNCYSSKLQTPHLTGLPFVAENRPKVELFFEEKAIREVMRRRTPTKYFWDDMTDLFWEEYPDEWIDRCFAAMALTPWHTHLILTKRPARMLKYFEDLNYRQEVIGIRAEYTSGLSRHYDGPGTTPGYGVTWRLPFKNVWLGVSVENQAAADERIPLLLQTPAAIRFVSYEPALGPVSFRWAQWDDHAPHERRAQQPPNIHRGGRTLAGCVDHLDGLRMLDWVIVGGESGPGARPFNVQWARNTVEQCKAAGVACFVKQLGADPREGNSNGNCRNLDCTHPDCGFVRLRLNDKKGGCMEEWAQDLRVRNFPLVQSPDTGVR